MKQHVLTSTFQSIRSSLFLRARRLLADDDDARDVLQEAFVRLWTHRDRITRESSAAGLLMTTVRNLSLNKLRDSSAHPTDPFEPNFTESSDDSPDEIAETFARVSKLIESSLSPRDRQILILRDRDEWDFDDIAQKFNLTAGNVRQIVARARKTIRKAYRDYHE